MTRLITTWAVLVAGLAPLALAQPTDGLPGRPRLPSDARPTTTSVAPTSSWAAFTGRYTLRGVTKTRSGEMLPTLVRLSISEGADGALSLDRTVEVTQPDGTERVTRATSCDVRQYGPASITAKLVFVHDPSVGMTGALSGARAERVENEVEWILWVGERLVSERTTNKTHRPPEQLAGSETTGQRTLLRDLTSAPVTTLVNNGPPADRYDLVFVSDGYTVADMHLFRRHVRDAVARLQAVSPWKEYWSYVNVHKVETPSGGPGVPGGRGGPSSMRTTIPTGVPSSQKIAHADEDTVKRAAKRAPGADAIIVLALDPFRSAAFDGFTLVSTWEDRFPNTVVHELGHVIGKLLDEYQEDEDGAFDFITANVFTEAFTRMSGWGANVTTHTDRDTIPWRRWLPAGVPLPTAAGSNHPVGLYRGAYHMNRYWHRPSPTCLMRKTDEPFCVVCREQMILSLSEKTFPVTITKQQLDEDTVRIAIASTIPGQYRIKWLRDGYLVHGGPSVRVTRDDLSWGDTVLWVQVEDLTPMVRDDPQGRTTFDFTFVLRKGLIWDKGLECVGPIRGRPAPSSDPFTGRSSSGGFPF